MDTNPLDAYPLVKSALPLVGVLLWEAWLGATKRVQANSTLGLVLSILTALWSAVAKAKTPPAALLLLALLAGCATAQGHYVTIPPDPTACAQAVLRAAKAQLPCDKSPPPPAEEIAACTLAAAAELLPCSPHVTWVADAPVVDAGR